MELSPFPPPLLPAPHPSLHPLRTGLRNKTPLGSPPLPRPLRPLLPLPRCQGTSLWLQTSWWSSIAPCGKPPGPPPPLQLHHPEPPPSSSPWTTGPSGTPLTLCSPTSLCLERGPQGTTSPASCSLRLFPDSGSCPAVASCSPAWFPLLCVSAPQGSLCSRGLVFCLRPEPEASAGRAAHALSSSPSARSSLGSVVSGVGPRTTCWESPLRWPGTGWRCHPPGSPWNACQGAGGDACPGGGGGEEAQTQAVPDPRLLSVPSPTTPSAHLSVALSPDPDLGKVSGAPVNCICAKDKKSQPHSA